VRASPSKAPSAVATSARPIVVTGYSVFASPTGNISCGIDEESGSVRCDIGEREWEAPPKPSDYEHVGTRHGFTLSRAKYTVF
jgi:hypothetical protein